MVILLWDLCTNMDISSGFCRCHSSLDLILTADGDLSIVDNANEMKQRFLLYLSTPKGERFNPQIGSACYDYLHEKNTRNNMRRMEQDVLGDMDYQFPEIDVSSVSCMKDISDPFQMKLDVRLSDGQNLQFLYTPEELVSLTTELTNLANSNY